MIFIGITGGVGAGKSTILNYLDGKERVQVLLADDIAHDLMKPGTECERKIRERFGTADIFLKDGNIDRVKMASVIFADEEKRIRMNQIVHPEVKKYIVNLAQEEREKGELDLLVLEAALLIEEHYDEICDELWYINTREDIREKRLMDSRGYSSEKVRQIIDSQLKEEEYRRHCSVVINNDDNIGVAFRQIDEELKNRVKE